jgi:hypothetical protein
MSAFDPLRTFGRLVITASMGSAALRRMLSLALVGLTAACAHVQDGTSDDLVVFGRVKSLDYEPLDELAIDGRITARLTITRVISGRPPAAVLTISYIAHTDLASDQEFRFHLRRSQQGVWLACAEGGSRGYVCR